MKLGIELKAWSIVSTIKKHEPTTIKYGIHRWFNTVFAMSSELNFNKSMSMFAECMLLLLTSMSRLN